ncbi:MAG: hypothetical protein ABI183_01140 [Polyangiaceae bacterium]
MRRTLLFVSIASLGVGVVLGCEGDDTILAPLDAGDDATASDVTTTPFDASVPDTSTEPVLDASDGSTVDRGPTVIPFSGDPAGLFWEYGTNGGLYVADQANSKIIKWTDAAGFGISWTLPAPQNSGSTLGQVVRALDGTMFVPRAGTGADNTVLWITNLGDAGDLALMPDASLDPSFTRSGFTLLPDNTTIDTRFADSDSGNVGTVDTLKSPPSESKLVSGLSKPLAVVYNESRLYIADQDLNVVIAIAQTGGSFVSDAGDGGGDGGGHGRVFVAIDQPNFACAGADGDLYVTSLNGSVYRVSSAGVATTIATGLHELRGVAFDGATHRIFVAEHGASVNQIRIYPID